METYKFIPGYVKPILYKKFEDGKMNTYSYSIRYDNNHMEISRTEPNLISSAGFEDRDFTEEEYNRIMCGGKKLTLWDKIWRFFNG